MTNRLAEEASVYLLQHKDNPVDWFPWGQEAFTLAKAEDKPIFLSVGYAACHWCHVMAHESFEDAETAEMMNRLFVNVKVDREERPDVDAVYMSASLSLTGHGGWPLSVFMTPEGHPFFAGTYFPNRPRGEMITFKSLLGRVADAWKTKKSAVMKDSEALTKAILANMSAASPADSASPVDSSFLERATVMIMNEFDEYEGGFGRAPKFPQPSTIELLLRRWSRTGEERLLEAVELTLTKMARGGIYDHLAGGFARYSTDREWLVPHFEKMLYDNALLARLYLHGYQATSSPSFMKVVERTLTFLEDELSHPLGGFFSSIDADSEEGEGFYYLWTPEEIENVLGPELSRIACRWWNVTETGNFEGRNILSEPLSLGETAREFNLTEGKVEQLLETARSKLLEARSYRDKPGVDDKIILAWNAMAAAAFAECGAVANREDWIERATACGEFILNHLYGPDGRLLRTWTDIHGARHMAVLEDYAFVIDAFLELWSAVFDRKWLVEAERLVDELLRLFGSDDGNLFYDTGSDAEKLIVRPHSLQDGAYPSGGAVAVMSMMKLALLIGRSDLTEHAERALSGPGLLMERAPSAVTHWLNALDFIQGPVKEIVIAGRREDILTKSFLAVTRGNFAPRQVIGLVEFGGHDDTSPMLRDKVLVAGRPAAYVCFKYVCEAPVTTVQELKALL